MSICLRISLSELFFQILIRQKHTILGFTPLRVSHWREYQASKDERWTFAP